MSTKKYPYIGKFNEQSYNTIVLFTNPKTGTCLTNDIKDDNIIGDFSETWEEDKFIPVEITVIEE